MDRDKLIELFNGKDLPEWMDEAAANQFCSTLNFYTQQKPSFKRWHPLNRFPSGRLYIIWS